jgi:phosphoglycolate phosphatase
MNILFDLDGTLTDPFLGITNCIMYALTELGRPSSRAVDLRWCIGPPLKKSFLVLLDSDDNDLAEKALAKYRERFGTIGLFENELYPEIPQVLDELSRTGHKLFVATSKPWIYAEKIIEHFGLTTYFQKVYGSELDGTRSDKTALISHLLRQESIAPSNAVMIGDRRHDMIGAKENGIASIGVLWGYGTRDELAEFDADICISLPKDLAGAINKLAIKSMQPHL